MIPADLLSILRCPLTGQTLVLADSSLLAQINRASKADNSPQKGLPNDAKAPMTERVAAALVRADGKVLYPIRDGIPVLLADEAIFR